MSLPFAHDPALPGLAQSLDARLVCRRVGEQLYAATGGRLDCSRVTVERLRYRPGDRAIVLYAAHLYDAAHCRPWQTWFSGSLYRGGKARRLAGRADGAAAGGCSLPPALLDPATDMLVQFYPHDRRLPALRRLLESDARTLAGLVGSRSARSRRLTPVRYRPGIGATLRCDGGEEEAYVKVIREGDARRRHEDLSGLLAALGDRCVTVPRPLGWDSALNAVAVARADGRSLSDVVLAGDEGAAREAGRRTARSLLMLHTAPVRVRRMARPEAVLAATEERVRLLRLACAEQGEVIDELMAAMAARLPDATAAPLHMDLKPEHVFLDDDRVCFIDMDDLAMGDPMLDVGMLLERLRALPVALGASPAVAAATMEGFLGTYLGGVAPQAAARLPAARIWAALRVAQFWLQHMVPDWRRLVARTLEQARDSLCQRCPDGV